MASSQGADPKTMTFTRQLKKLQPGEKWESDLLVDLPDGYRLETDAEFRERILQKHKTA